MDKGQRNNQWLARAERVIPGGVNSPVRAFQAVGGMPPFIDSAQGCLVKDVEGRRYIDYVGSWGPMILGHARPEVVEAVLVAAARGLSFGATTPLEVRMAETICRFFPSIEKVRLVNSGTEATMSALRLARAFSGRSLIVKFDGCYHGHSDGLLVEAGSGPATLGLTGSPGVPEEFAQLTLSLPFNDSDAIEEAFERHRNRIAAVILEPVAGNMGVVSPKSGFLKAVVRLCRDNGAVSIFDEVMTGFRLAPGGAQELYSLKPDLTCLGKIVGGGLPIGAYGGRRDIMNMIAPLGSVYQAGTLSGNPVAVSAGLATLEILERENPYSQLERQSERLCRGLRRAAAQSAIDVQVQRCGSMFTVFFSSAPVTDFASAKRCDTSHFARFFRLMLQNGVYMAPSQFEACFISSAHSDATIEETVRAAELSFSALCG